MARGSTVAVRFTGDVADLDRALGRVESGLGRASGRIAGFARGIAGALAGVAVLDFGRDVVGAASDMQETVSRANTIFGGSSSVIRAWAQGAAEDFGVSEQAALDAAGTFGNLFTQLGIGTDPAADMSQALVELGSDFASFHNANPPEVIDAMTAAFRGEYDALQRFVPTINAAAVQQRAMADTGKTNAQALTEQEKAAATYALMLEGAGAAAGDFDRTSDSLANRNRTLSGQWDDMKAKIGQALVPAMAALTGFLSRSVIPGIESLVAKVREFWPAVQRFFAPAVEWFRSTLAPAVAEVARGMISGFQSVVDWVREVWPQLSEAVGHVVAVVQEVWSRFGDEILDRARIVWDAIRETVENAIGVVKGVIETVMAIINGDWGKAWDAIKGIAEDLWDQIKVVVETAIGLIKNTIELTMELINAAWDLAWEAIKTILSEAWAAIVSAVSTGIDTVLTFFRALPGNIVDAIGDVASLLWQKGADIVQGLANGIVTIWSNVVSFFSGLPGAIAEAIGDLSRTLYNKGRDLIGGFFDGIRDEMSSAGFGGQGLFDLPEIIGNIPGFASGTSFAPGGLAWVGEHGPELVNLPRGSEVFSHSRSMQMASAAAAGVTVAAGAGGPQVVVHGPLVSVDARGATSEAVERLRLQFPGEAERAARAIQRALGG